MNIENNGQMFITIKLLEIHYKSDRSDCKFDITNSRRNRLKKI